MIKNRNASKRPFETVKSRLSSLPSGITWPGIAVIGISAGIGFTIAFFEAQLAYPAGEVLETAKLGILAASAAGAAGAHTLGILTLKRKS
ncbi:MAG: Na+/H+ antiporter NhaA [Chitinophagaceae bacterium]|nr:Na+/H+ antiporter NhaA [Oligoflexus sp.]